ncbi:hypothetical protein QR665_14685 [Acinetobacter gerneri]|uniref:hypothetical protein n=1 Tax=Acinetobacter gerneri TaxID=202952 RepID=UPI002935D6BA|nr:hypothetical protein [Acinetobacter gerneri]MDV2440707.1 hypothetical protein [Acinetobacter gerneri]
MGFQTEVKTNISTGPQNKHLIGYVVDGNSHNLILNSNQITNSDGSMNYPKICSIVAGEHSGQSVLILAISDIGEQQ